MAIADTVSHKSEYKIPWPLVVSAIIACEVFTIIVTLLLVSNLYYKLALGSVAMVDLHRSLAIVIAALFLVIGSLRGDYSYANLTSKRRAIEQLMRSWSITVICILFLLFMTKTSSDFSRGALVISYFVGLVFLSLVRRTAATTCIALAGYGRIAGARMMLVGTEAAISHFRNSARLSHNGTEIVETVVIVKSGECALSKQLETAVEIGRRCRPDEIMVN